MRILSNTSTTHSEFEAYCIFMEMELRSGSSSSQVLGNKEDAAVTLVVPVKRLHLYRSSQVLRNKEKESRASRLTARNIDLSFLSFRVLV